MIRVVNLSPAIDITYELPSVTLGESLRVQRVIKAAGGKGVNVARVISAGGYPVQLVLPLGGEAGAWIEKQLAQHSIALKKVPIEAETRSCVAVVAEGTTVLNEPAAAITASEFEDLLKLLSEHSSTTVLSGSLPASLSEQQITRLLSTLRKSSEQLIVDTSGPGLMLAAAAGADLLKPNRAEAMAATGAATPELAAKQLIEKGAHAVLLSDGEKGAALISETRTLRAKTVSVSGNPTGAGDAMVALAAIAMASGSSDESLLKNAVAAGSLAVAEPIAGVIDWGRLEKTAAEVEVG